MYSRMAVCFFGLITSQFIQLRLPVSGPPFSNILTSQQVLLSSFFVLLHVTAASFLKHIDVRLLGFTVSVFSHHQSTNMMTFFRRICPLKKKTKTPWSLVARAIRKSGALSLGQSRSTWPTRAPWPQRERFPLRLSRMLWQRRWGEKIGLDAFLLVIGITTFYGFYHV